MMRKFNFWEAEIAKREDQVEGFLGDETLPSHGALL